MKETVKQSRDRGRLASHRRWARRFLLAIVGVAAASAGAAPTGWLLRDKDVYGSRNGGSASVSVNVSTYTNVSSVPNASLPLTGNVLGGSTNELVVNVPGGIGLFDATGRQIGFISTSAQLACLSDVNGDGVPEILGVEMDVNYNFQILVYQGDGALLKTIHVAGTGQSDQSVTPMFAADLNGDGRVEIVSQLASGYGVASGGVRGLEVTSYSTGQRMWRAVIGPFPNGVRWANTRGGGLLAAGWGPDNGNVGADATADSANYTWSYAPVTGLTTWIRSYTSGGFLDSGICLPDMNGDGAREILAVTTEHDWSPGDYGYGELHVLNPQTGSDVTAISLGHYVDIWNLAFGNLDQAPGNELVVATYEGTTPFLRTYGSNLMAKASYSRPSGQFIPMAVADLAGSGAQQVLAIYRPSSGNDRLIILNGALTRVLWEGDLGLPTIQNVIVDDLSRSGELDVVVAVASANETNVVVLAPASPLASPPMIEVPPASQTNIVGTRATFGVTAAGTLPLSYQWFFNQTNALLGATNTSLTLPDVQPSDAGGYSVVVTNSAGSVTSTVATLTVLVPPTIVVQPTDQTLTLGGTATFRVVAAGSAPLSYQWFFGQTNLLSGSTNASLGLPGVQPSDAGGYSVVVANAAGSVASVVATLTVLIPPSITGQPADVVTNQGANVAFSVAATGTPPLHYQWWFDGTNQIASATNATVNLLGVQPSQAGTYSATVSNLAGSTNSRAALLTVIPNPGTLLVSIQSPADATSFAAGSKIPVAASASEPNGSVRSLSVFDQLEGSTLSLLASAASASCSFVWTNAPAGTNFLSAIATDALGVSATSAVVRVVITNPTPVLTVGATLTAPANDAAFCYGNDVQLSASVTSSVPVSAVEFYAGGTLLGRAVSVPYTYDWPSPQVGDYTLSARVTDAQGHTAVSKAINIVVTPQCSPVAIVRPGPDPEIDAMQSYLLSIGLGSQVFDQDAISINVLQGFKLVIWDDLGAQTNGLNANTVDVLDGVYGRGVPLYLIGEHLVSASAQLPPMEQAEWQGLTHLRATSGGIPSGCVTIIDPEGPSNPVLWGQFWSVGDFCYAPRIEMATNDSASELLGQSDGASVLLMYPPFDSPGATPVVAQDFRVLPPDVSAATNELTGLFKNAVCWLTGCGYCQDAGLGLEASQTNYLATVGQAMAYTLTASCNGECPPVQVRLTNSLPAGFVFLGATNEQGSWTYDAVQRQVVFYIGEMPQEGSVDLQVTVAPMQIGTFTNNGVIRLAYGPLEEKRWDIEPPMVITVLPATDVAHPRLSLRLLSPVGLELSLMGEAGQVYGIESSPDLLHWEDFTNVLGPVWAGNLAPWPGTNAAGEFYRAWTSK